MGLVGLERPVGRAETTHVPAVALGTLPAKRLSRTYHRPWRYVKGEMVVQRYSKPGWWAGCGMGATADSQKGKGGRAFKQTLEDSLDSRRSSGWGLGEIWHLIKKQVLQSPPFRPQD